MADAPPEVLADVDAITAVDAKVYRAAVLRLLCDIRALEEAAGARVAPIQRREELPRPFFGLAQGVDLPRQLVGRLI